MARLTDQDKAVLLATSRKPVSEPVPPPPPQLSPRQYVEFATAAARLLPVKTTVPLRFVGNQWRL